MQSERNVRPFEPFYIKWASHYTACEGIGNRCPTWWKRIGPRVTALDTVHHVLRPSVVAPLFGTQSASSEPTKQASQGGQGQAHLHSATPWAAMGAVPVPRCSVTSVTWSGMPTKPLQAFESTRKPIQRGPPRAAPPRAVPRLPAPPICLVRPGSGRTVGAKRVCPAVCGLWWLFLAHSNSSGFLLSDFPLRMWKTVPSFPIWQAQSSFGTFPIKHKLR